MQPKYTIDYFIKKFSLMPPEYFGLSTEEPVPNDAWEWLDLPEAWALYVMISPFGMLIQVNDGIGPWAELGEHPKARVLKFLDFVKKGRQEYYGY